MTVVKEWNPWRELEDIRTRLGRFLGESGADTPIFADWMPAVDIQETEKEYVIKADLPDVSKNDVRVHFDEGVLTLEGERKLEEEEQDRKYHRVERSYGKFVRRFAMPTEVDAMSVMATFKDGVLNVRLPKSVKVKPTAFDVKVA